MFPNSDLAYMSSKIKLSFILPCYNVEKYISVCLDSIYQQDIPQEEYEVICVNDSSCDGTRNIIIEYQKLHPNLIFIEHETNMKQGSARNSGLQAAQGEYIWFVDADDWIEKNSLYELTTLASRGQLDLLIFNFYKQDSQSFFERNTKPANSIYSILDGKTYLALNFDPQILSPCSAIYKLEYLNHFNLKFADGVFWEDADFVLQAYYHARRIECISDHLYYYRYNNDSTSRTRSGEKYADIVKMGARKLEFARKIQFERPDLAKLIQIDAIWNATAIKKIILLPHKERIYFYHNLEGAQYKEIKSLVTPIYLRFLFNHPKIALLFFIIVYPVTAVIKNLKHKHVVNLSIQKQICNELH